MDTLGGLEVSSLHSRFPVKIHYRGLRDLRVVIGDVLVRDVLAATIRLQNRSVAENGAIFGITLGLVAIVYRNPLEIRVTLTQRAIELPIRNRFRYSQL